MSTQLITFENNKLVLTSQIDCDAKVITVTGQARKGKSSLLNTICSYLNNTDNEIFKSSSSVDHVTRGISYYYFADKKIMLIDTQGLDYGNSSDDHKILLFCYSISDIMIFNEKEMFNNGSLNTLSQLASFVNRIDIKTKPELIIRIADYDLDDSIDSNIGLTMKKQDDQYQNIRNAIKTLFSNITGLSTSYLSKNDKTNMKQHVYTKILSNEDNNYLECVKSIVMKLELCMIKMINSKTINLLIDAINNNHNIDHKHLDLYSLISTNQLLEFQKNISKELYKNIHVDGTQTTYNRVYIPRYNKYKEIMDTFDKMFNLIPDEIKNKERHDIDTKLKFPLDTAYVNTIKQGQKLKHSVISKSREINIVNYKSLKNSHKIYNCLDKPYYSNDKRQILIKNKKEYIKDILYSVTCYYISYLDRFNVSDIFSQVYHEQIEIYSKSINELEEKLNEMYEISNKLNCDINNNIDTLQKLSFDEIYKDTKFNILPLFNRLKSFDLEDIVSYIYDNMLHKIDRNIPNYHFSIMDTIIELKQKDMFVLYTHNSIIEKFMDSITDDQIKMQELQNIVIDSIYNDYIMKTSNENISEVKLTDLYNCIEIKYVKICIPDSNKIKWIMNTLKTKYNVIIPENYIHNKLNDIIKNAKRINNNIFIEYDIDESDRIQKQTYLIDCLYHELMVSK